MLSAVAARKARREAQHSPQLSSLSPSPVHSSTNNENPPKRKLSKRSSKNPESKKRKVNRQEGQKRHSAEDSFKSQHDIIAVCDGDDESGDSSEGEAVVEEHERRDFPSTTRKWSPSAPLRSSDEEDVDEPEDIATSFDFTPAVNQKPSQKPLLSTWRPIKNQTVFTLGSEDLRALRLADTIAGRLCLVQKGDRLTLVGVYTLTVAYGSVTLAGTQLSPQSGSHRVFAPWSSPLPAIVCATPSNIHPGSLAALSPDLQEIISGADAAVIIQELSTGIEGLGKVCRTFENVFTLPGARPVDDIEMNGVHYVEAGTHALSPFVIPSSWEQACCSVLQETEEASRLVYVVQGAKKTGKSSFARILSNSLLTKYKKVAFLECDLGQSEFTPGGMTALNILDSPCFGPSFSHPSIPYRAHYIGSTSPKDCPRTYIETISALIQSYNLDIQFGDGAQSSNLCDNRTLDTVPLVVNTMGWTKGLGADLSIKVLDIVQPLRVFNLEVGSEEDDWVPYQGDSGSRVPAQGSDTGFRSQTLQSPVNIGSTIRFTPTDYRNISLLSYFHAVFSSDHPSHDTLTSAYATAWKTSLPLCAQEPYTVSVRDAIDKIILVGAGTEDVVPTELSRVLNGSVVGLVSHQEGFTPDEATMDSVTGLPFTRGTLPPSPTVSRCLGLALVRSSLGDPSVSTKFQLLTPIPSLTLLSASPRVLVKGPMELPVWGWLDFRDLRTVAGSERQYVPYLRWGKGEGAGADRRRARRNLMRYGLY
ncbi:hypothetical protein BDY19DRAFT_997886 [Irpex rosettiformis]|uniref:Uncharacterized protein n=1 Tax=Irpex rosettiformis TaxID=378272 RepID=A0ACB8TQ88_9APHY|nr:hypothetical protein BDY19DRAFT_997886 [Irpex rosettiformis]